MKVRERVLSKSITLCVTATWLNPGMAQTHELANIQIQKAGLGPDPHQQKHLPGSDLSVSRTKCQVLIKGHVMRHDRKARELWSVLAPSEHVF